MPKHKLRYGYRTIKCPMCKSKTFDYCSYSEYGWGIVEQHGYCKRCGYVVEQAYSPAMEAFLDIKKGFKMDLVSIFLKMLKSINELGEN